MILLEVVKGGGRHHKRDPSAQSHLLGNKQGDDQGSKSLEAAAPERQKGRDLKPQGMFTANSSRAPVCVLTGGFALTMSCVAVILASLLGYSIKLKDPHPE